MRVCVIGSGGREHALAHVLGRTAQVVQMRDAWVAKSRAEADAVYGPHVMTAYKYYFDNRLAEFRTLPPGTPFTLEALAPDRLILGDPETCVREFHRWHKATGAQTFLLRFRHARRVRETARLASAPTPSQSGHQGPA